MKVLPLSYIEIHKQNLLSNIEHIKMRLPKGNRLVEVVKANAYGHGLREVITIANEKVDGFQVDDLEELREARKYTDKQIFVFGYVMKDQLPEVVELKGTLGVYTLDHIQALNDIGKERSEVISVHLKIDALLGRQGILIAELDTFIHEIKKLSCIQVEAVYSHFSNIEDTDNLDHARAQHELLIQAKERMHALGITDVYHHISATSGFLVDQDANWGGALVRLGIGLYGIWPSESLQNTYYKDITLQPVLRWVSHCAQVKHVPASYPIGYGLSHVTKQPTTIAIIPQGYSDGYDRGFSNTGEVLIRGEHCPIIGRVAMNMFVVDVSHVDGVESEDEVVLLGVQGQAFISAEYLASKINTINYEVLARISPLLKRIVK